MLPKQLHIANSTSIAFLVNMVEHLAAKEPDIFHVSWWGNSKQADTCI